MTRQQGLQLQTAGMMIVVLVMVLDKFVFSLQEPFILACAILAAVLLMVGIHTVKKQSQNI